MTYIENILICLVIPLFLSLPFRRGSSRRFTLFTIIGMCICLLSAYVNSFFMELTGANAVSASVEIAPLSEEIMKALPLLFYILVFEPSDKGLAEVAIAIAVGFATFENVCYLTENGAENFLFLLIRGISAGALHVLCGTFFGLCSIYIFSHSWLAFTGTVCVLGACAGFHGIYNLLITGNAFCRTLGYLFPTSMLGVLFVGRYILKKQKIGILKKI